jgi:predicted TPR repeat methyltransferase
MNDTDMARLWLDQGAMAGQAGQHELAVQAYEAALALDPALGEAALGLGLSLMALRRFTAALAPLRLAAGLPEAVSLWHGCLAQCLYMTGAFDECRQAFERAGALEPLGDNARVTLARARALAAMIEGSVEAALDCYRDEIGASPEDLAAFVEEASAVLAVFGHVRPAAALGRRQLADDPSDGGPADGVLAYRLQALEGAAVDRSPADYIEAHFDAFAERFDHQLVEMLRYDAPARLAALLAGQRPRFDEVLDLGCGTGLAAEPLRPMAGRLTGVDLSGGMLARAAERQLYDDLVQAEALDFLAGREAAYDLVFAADVLIYFGDLEPLFAAVGRALKPGGYFAFSSESAADGWRLLTSGRFAHADAYLDQRAAGGFVLRARAPTELRLEGNRPVDGALHLLERR